VVSAICVIILTGLTIKKCQSMRQQIAIEPQPNDDVEMQQLNQPPDNIGHGYNPNAFANVDLLAPGGYVNDEIPGCWRHMRQLFRCNTGNFYVN
jgi:hypothetical protein